jgi:hypothetical protein
METATGSTFRRRNESEHQVLVQWLGDLLVRRMAVDIRVDLPGRTRPEEIRYRGDAHGHIPDASCRMGGHRYVFEVETDDTITIKHTADQWRLFHAWARLNNATFVVVVPDGFQEAALRQLNDLQLVAEVW